MLQKVLERLDEKKNDVREGVEETKIQNFEKNETSDDEAMFFKLGN